MSWYVRVPHLGHVRPRGIKGSPFLQTYSTQHRNLTVGKDQAAFGQEAGPAAAV